MTVIACNLQGMAADTGATVEGVRFYRTKKIKRLSNGALVAFAGDGDVADRITLKLNKIVKQRQIRMDDLKTTGSAYGAYLCEHGIYRLTVGRSYAITKIEDDMFAEGCGFKIALAAMMCGATPEEACEVATELDTSCCGPVQVERL